LRVFDGELRNLTANRVPAARVIAHRVARHGRAYDVQAGNFPNSARFSAKFLIERINAPRAGRTPIAAGSIVNDIVTAEPDKADRTMPPQRIIEAREPSVHNGAG
jgi:hypothetical protein